MIYFDHAATTRILPEAAQAAMKTMTEDYGNPSSLYQLGVQAAKRMGSTGSRWPGPWAVRGRGLFYLGRNRGGQLGRCPGGPSGPPQGRHIITTAIEHAAVLQPCKELERQGYEVTYLHPDASGRSFGWRTWRPPSGRTPCWCP